MNEQDTSVDFNRQRTEQIEFGAPNHRGVPLIFAWGPHTGLSYQRPDWKQISLEQLKKDAIDRFVKWGANIVELYPSNKESHFDDFTGKENSAVPLHCFREHPDADQENRWTMDDFREFNRYARQNDFLTVLFIHAWWPASYEHRARVLWKLFREIGQNVGDVLADGFGPAIDGYAAEGDLIVPEEANDMLWPYHPGMYLRESAWGLNTGTANYLQPRGFHLTDGRTLIFDGDGYSGLASECLTGFENVWQGKEVKLRHGKLHVSLQAEGRDTKFQDESWGAYGGMATVDMFVEQIHNYARAKGRGWTTASTTGVRVINEPLLSPAMKRYMGGICNDPIRCAIAAKLEATAKDGRYPRTDYKQGSWFIQNNFFRAYIEPEAAKADLYYDNAGQGNFTNFLWKTSSILLKDFISSRFAEDQRLDFHESEALEEAGSRAILRQRCTFKSGKASMDEFRDYQADADNPWLWIKIQRVFLGPERRRFAVNTLNLEGYQPRQEITPGKVSILDPPAGKPSLALFVPENDQLEKLDWDPAGKLNILAKPAESHEFKIGLMVAVPAELDAEQLTRQARFLSDDLCFDMDRGLQREVVVPAAPDTELVRAIWITNPPGGPYMVCENGWWQMRGAQPSWNQRDTDLLKVVLSPHTPTRVRPYGFIDGAVKSGWGCQYTLLLGSVSMSDGVSTPDGDSARATVRVIDISPKIWAPRLHFSRRIAAARLDGKAWHYFDGQFVFLPNCRGDYEVELEFGRPRTPHAICTFAHVEETDWDGQTLTVKTRLPQWADDLPSGSKYYLAVGNAGRKLQRVENGDVCRSVPDFKSVKPEPIAGPDGVATLVPREFNHPPVSGYRNTKGQTVAFEPPTTVKFIFDRLDG
ncbi:MAG: hypothetical protein U9N87_03740 [Planctomycetota bacterium]|nr:hypothetical protein [Planctomycetota bacterium]